MEKVFSISNDNFKKFMQLQIETVHIEPGEELTELIQRKIGHLEKRYDRINHCDVVLRKDKNDVKKSFFVETKIEVPGNILFASDKAESFEEALSKVVDDLEHQLAKFKEELDDRR